MSSSMYLAVFRGPGRDDLRLFYIFADSRSHAEDLLASLRAKESVPESWDVSLSLVPCAIGMGLAGTYKEVFL